MPQDQVQSHLVKDFTISYRSPSDGKLYEGTFTTKKLSVKSVGALRVRKVQLNGGYYFDPKTPGVGIDAQTDNLNFMIAHLEISLIRNPFWWNLDDICDQDLILAVFDKVFEFEENYYSPQPKAAVDGTGSRVDSGAENQGANVNGHIATVGGAKIQDSLEP